MISKFLTALLLSLVTISAAASPEIPCISRAEGDSIARQLVRWNGRICPLNTLATHFTLEVCGERRPHGYTPEQVVISWQRYPDVWNRAPLIRVENKTLRQLLNLKGKSAAITQLYDARGYRLQTILDTASNERLRHDITLVDQRVKMVGELLNGTLIQPAPAGTPALSPWRMRWEFFKNRFPLFDIGYVLFLLLTLVAFIYDMRR